MVIDPYHEAGLERNPFAWMNGKDAGPFIDHLELTNPEPGMGTLRQLIGEKGAGKSTHLTHWLEVVGGDYFYVEEGSTADPPLGPLVYWDEADRLSDKQLRRLFRQARLCGHTIVAGTHRDLSRPARRTGLPTETVALGPVTLPLLRRWVETRIESAQIDPSAPSSVKVSDAELAELLRSQPSLSLRFAGDDLHQIVARIVRS